MVGQTISNYHIVAKLGEGGMGVVYKARDIRLDRFLALKFLAPEQVTDERKRRFFQEAKAASALNHPNIIHIYDIGEWEGSDFIAMEYVDGDTLRQALNKGPITIDEALRYAIQAADALSAAHAAGIVHRDLKPGNVMIGPRGLVKILDFGLAKLKEPDPSAEHDEFSESSDTRTLFDPAHTKFGLVVGSPAYMSPEQVLAKDVDERSDIFAFGALLYEMLAHRQAFTGKARLELFSAILHVDPPPPSTVNPSVSRELDWVVAHCLRKDPERRFQSMVEVKIALDDLRTGSISGVGSAMTPPSPPAKKGHWVAGTLTAIALGCGVAGGLWLLRDHKPALSQGAGGPLEITRLTTEAGLSVDSAISPDGKLLAYASDRGGEGNLDIWVKQIGGGDAIRLTRDPADDVEPNFSPDGTTIVFRSGKEGGGLYLIPALGGVERKLAAGGRRPQFSPDGSKIAYWTGPADAFPLRSGMGQIYVLDLATSTIRQIRKDFPAAVHPVWSPDGKNILFLGLEDAADAVHTFDWWITPVDGGTPVKCGVLEGQRFLDPFAWRGNRVYFSGREAQATKIVGEVTIDPKTWQSVGGPRRLTAATSDEYSPSASRDGHLVFASVTGNSDLYNLPFDANRARATGSMQRLTTDVSDESARAISPDGTRVVFVSNRTGAWEILGKELPGGQERALTADGRSKTATQISRDGRRVAWKVNSINDRAIFVTPFDGGTPVQICADCGNPDAWSSDGRFLLYARRESSKVFVGLLEVATGKKVEYLRSPQLGLRVRSISNDGKWVAFNAYRTDRDFTTYVAPFSPDRTPAQSEWIRIPLSSKAHPNPCWSPKGNLLYFSSEQDGYACLWAQRLNPATKQPLGEAFAVQHFHSPSLILKAPSFSLPLALAADKIVVSLEERSGGIWMLKLRD